MKAVELIEELKKYPPDLKVCVIDSDWGCLEMSKCEVRNEHIQKPNELQSGTKQDVLLLSE
jgi:hypothetical protein